MRFPVDLIPWKGIWTDSGKNPLLGTIRREQGYISCNCDVTLSGANHSVVKGISVQVSAVPMREYPVRQRA